MKRQLMKSAAVILLLMDSREERRDSEGKLAVTADKECDGLCPYCQLY